MAASVGPADSTIRPLTQDTATSGAMEACTTVAAPDASATIPASVAPVTNPTVARDELIPTPRPVIERGSGSRSARSSLLEELTRQTVHQFFVSMRSCIDLIFSGDSSFEFARLLLGNLIENINHTGGPSQAKACLLLVDQLGKDLEELKSLEDAGSFHEARTTLTRLLATQEQERREMEEKIAEKTHLLQCFQADHRKLTGESK